MDEGAQFPPADDPSQIGTFPAVVGAGGGLVWDAVLEYRVWCHPRSGDDDYYYAFTTHVEAEEFANSNDEAEEPLVLIAQEEYIEESEPGEYEHRKERRLTEWPPEFVTRPRRTGRTIPDFLAPDAPSNRLEILRGAPRPNGTTAHPQ